MTRTLQRVAPTLVVAAALSCAAMCATPAAAEPYPWHRRLDDASVPATLNKAQIEHHEQLTATALQPSKAQIEHHEQLTATALQPSKAQIEHHEQLMTTPLQPNKAQIEHGERIAAQRIALASRAQIEHWERVATAHNGAQIEQRDLPAGIAAAPATPDDSSTGSSWELAGFGALGIAGVALMGALTRSDAIGS